MEAPPCKTTADVVSNIRTAVVRWACPNVICFESNLLSEMEENYCAKSLRSPEEPEDHRLFLSSPLCGQSEKYEDAIPGSKKQKNNHYIGIGEKFFFLSKFGF